MSEMYLKPTIDSGPRVLRDVGSANAVLSPSLEQALPSVTSLRTPGQSAPFTLPPGTDIEQVERVLEQHMLSSPEAAAEAATGLLNDRQFIRAERFLTMAHERHPDHPYLRYLLALGLYHRIKFEPAIQHCMNINNLQAVLLAARCLTKQHRPEAAVGLLEGLYGTIIDQDDLANWHAEALLQLGRPIDALAVLKDRTDTWSLFHSSILHLGLGNWPLGWQLYRLRDMAADYPRAASLDELRDKRVLVFAEQGLGDIIQFLRYTIPLRPLVKHLILAVSPSLVKLTQTLPIDATVVPDDVVAPPYDVSVALLDLPELFGTTLDTIPPPTPFALPSQSLISKRIGLCWHGSSRPDNVESYTINQRRSVPYKLLRPLLELPDYEFVSLQLEPSPLPSLFESTDFYESALALRTLDLVISVDTSVAHLAASLGIETWLLNRFDSCFRWFWDGSTTSPWYPSLRIYRQTERDGLVTSAWESVIAQVTKDLTTAPCLV